MNPGPKKSEMPSQISPMIKRRKFMVFSSKPRRATTPPLHHMLFNWRLKQNGKHGRIRKEHPNKMPELLILSLSRLFSENEKLWLQDIYALFQSNLFEQSTLFKLKICISKNTSFYNLSFAHFKVLFCINEILIFPLINF